MESSRFRLPSHRSPILSSFSNRELSLHASHLLGTKLAVRYRTKYAKNPAEERRNGERNEVDYVLYRFRHREGSMPDMN